MKKKIITPKRIFNLLIVGLCAGIVLYFFFSKNGLNDLLHSDLRITWRWVAVAAVSQLLYMLLETIVIYMFIKDDCRNFRFTDALKVSFMGLFWSAVTPSSTGGQPMQVYLLHSMKIGIGYSTSRLMQKFTVYQVVLTLISIVSVILNLPGIMASSNLALLAVLLVFGFVSQLAVTGAILLFSFSPGLSKRLIMFIARLLGRIRIIKNLDKRVEAIERQLDNFHTSNKDIYKKPGLLIPAVILTFLQFVAMFLVPYFVYRALGFKAAGPADIISCQAFVNLMSGMIPIPGASGAAELGFTAFFGAYFINGTLKSAALIWRIINYYGVICITAPFAYLTKDKTRQAKEAEKSELHCD